MAGKKILTKMNATPLEPTYFHGTKAQLSIGDYITPGHNSNYGTGKEASYIYLSGTLDAAIWGAELAKGEGKERIYLVEATGELEDDPNVTNKRFPGNPTLSYRSTSPFLVVGEVGDWLPHPAEQVQAMKATISSKTDDDIL